ncbi:imidazoleglycerol-phosphate dehydratase [Ruminococcaceae bacterium YRB3002]|nr:imidazoleglycerol-phosphate dehydratase [Ruminococcaceae bacterium YRB3002]
MARTGEIKRTTKETDISVWLDLDGKGDSTIDTGIGFFDHMLTALSKHSGIDMKITCKGDLEVDAHHSVEDVGIALGKAFDQALGDKKGITRFGSSAIPLDEALSRCVVDISGRPFIVFDCEFTGDMCGTMDTQLFEEFFRSFAYNALITLHVANLYGTNDHHKAESMFKSCARALRQAVAVDERFAGQVVSTKGVL